MSAVIQECVDCGTQLFPERLLCPACGHDRFVATEHQEATIEDLTVLADGITLATLRLDSGLHLIARLSSTETRPGHRVSLTNHPGEEADAFIPLAPNAAKDSQ